MYDKRHIASFFKDGLKNDIPLLFAKADQIRGKYVGEAVYLRGIIEFSNYCARDCLYCGLRKGNRKLKRYRMDFREIYAAARRTAGLGISTVVLQSGEDPGYGIENLCELVGKIKKLNVAVTLSIGELSFAQYRQLKESGADRYLLKFETSDQRLYRELRPGCRLSSRLRCLEYLKKLGYEAGSGAMIGLPGQSPDTIAGDILLFKALNLDMIGIGPFIPHPHTPLAGSAAGKLPDVLKAVALARIITKNTNIPATTATGTIDSQGRQKALSCGANIIMPNMTPVKYRKLYQIYPDKICISEAALKCRGCVGKMVTALGRKIGVGFGERSKVK